MIGETISHYRVIEKLGGGGMGVVYKARGHQARPQGRAQVPSRRARERFGGAERFEREARAASALNHPNICTVYEIDEFEGQHFIALELLEGVTLTSPGQDRKPRTICWHGEKPRKATP